MLEQPGQRCEKSIGGLAVMACYARRLGMNEITFVIEGAPEGGSTVRALGAAIFTEADGVDELRAQVRDAVRRHFDEGDRPKVIRLHSVREEALAG